MIFRLLLRQLGILYANATGENFQRMECQSNYGFHDDRSLDYITLLAEDYEYTETRTRLFL